MVSLTAVWLGVKMAELKVNRTAEWLVSETVVTSEILSVALWVS